MRSLFLVLAFYVTAVSALAQGGAPADSSNPSQSQSVEETFKSFGLTGAWSTNCGESESPKNWYGRFVNSGGKITQVFTNGSGGANNRYDILEATRVAPDQLRVKVRFYNSQFDEIQNMEWTVRDGRSRTFTNVSEKRGPIVTDGVVISTKNETPWISRCN